MELSEINFHAETLTNGGIVSLVNKHFENLHDEKLPGTNY